MSEVSLDELMGFISMNVFCPDNPHRNLALRALAGDIVYNANQYTTKLARKAKKNTKLFGPAGTVMLSALRDWFGEDTPRCWIKLADLFDDCPYFTVTEVTTLFAVTPTPAVRLNVGMLIEEAAAARAVASG